ncbi:MAG: hypothetical protein F4Z00_08465 [Acidimicrobiaceae bacterium]|nr:hypothetical protein [Acidimicrobiaceae bacterium]MYF33156.1 hypothetical protein [Acidimicrobiaceae bacterium]
MSDSAVSGGYAGGFDPEWTLDRLSRAALARLCREYMVVSMYHDRALMPHIAISAGQEATIRQADSEWMGSSPVYTERNKRNLGIVGDGVGEAFKGFQFDVGAPHHFLDFHFEVVDHDLGYFWLPFCGAHHYLRELTGNDPHLVTNMCHHMEDRTFDATLAVTNPKLRAIPVHRPPKPDEFTGDHCRWEVRVVEDESGPRPGEPSLEVVSQSAAATFTFELGESREAGGMEDYTGPMRPDFRLEDLSHALLVRQAKEFALDVHLLMRAAYFSVDENFGPELLDEVAPQHRAAIAPVLVARLREALGIEGDDMAAIGKVLQVDPFLVDDYVGYSVEVHNVARGSISFGECAGIGDDACRSPLDWIDGFIHMAQTVNPRCVATRTSDQSWDLRIDPEAEPVEPHWLAEMCGGGGLRHFDLTERRVELGRRVS